VYLAEDLKHHRKVAVKVLRPDLAATLGPERFIREIEVAAQLHHPHILPLYDSGEADGFLFYVMPYEEGKSLRERLEKEKRERLEREKLEKKKEDEAKKKREREDLAKKKLEDDKRRKEEELAKAEAEKARAAAAAAKKTEFDRFVNGIRAKIRGRANVPDTVTGKPEVHVLIKILPGGEVLDIRITQRSGNPTYDTAIERGIRSASPLPVPPVNSELFPQFRELNLIIQHER